MSNPIFTHLPESSALKPNISAGLERFAQDLLRFNRAANLISRRQPEVELQLLLRECVGVGLWLRRQGLGPGAWLDLGSGGGFPGLVFAALDPQQAIVLVERRQGRCDFLRREVVALGLESVEVVEGDARSLARDARWAQRARLVSLKAVAPPSEAVALAEPFVAPGGRILLFQRPGWAPAEGLGWQIEARWAGSGDLEQQGAFLLARSD